jgi:TonB family protein
MNNKVQHGLVAKPTTGNSISVAKTNEVATQTITTNRVPITTSVPVTLPVAKKGSSIKIVGLQRKVEYRPMFKLPVWVEESGKNLIGELKFWVLPDGSVDRVYVIKTFGYVQIDDLAVNTILRWRFEPLPEGVNREDWGIVRIKIQLE